MNQHYRTQHLSRHTQLTMTTTIILPAQKPSTMNWHRSNIISPTSTMLLITTPHNYSKPKPPPTRTPNTKTNFPLNPNHNSTIPHPSLFSHRTNTILYFIRSYPNPHPNPNHTMGQPTRTPKRWHLPPILHPYQLFTPTNCNPPPTHTNRHTTPNNTKVNPTHPKQQLLNYPPIKSSPTNSLHSKSTPIRTSPMTS